MSSYQACYQEKSLQTTFEVNIVIKLRVSFAEFIYYILVSDYSYYINENPEKTVTAVQIAGDLRYTSIIEV